MDRFLRGFNFVKSVINVRMNSFFFCFYSCSCHDIHLLRYSFVTLKSLFPDQKRDSKKKMGNVIKTGIFENM